MMVARMDEFLHLTLMIMKRIEGRCNMKIIRNFIKIIIVVLGIPLCIVILFSIIDLSEKILGKDKEMWFSQDFDNGKYIIEGKKDHEIFANEYITIKNSEGDIIYKMQPVLMKTYHSGSYNYSIQDCESYLKLTFVNENNKVCQVYRIYYEDLEKISNQ